MTWRSLIHSSLRAIAQLGPGRTASTSETTDALLVLNSMLDSWNTLRSNIFTIDRQTVALSAGVSSYNVTTTARPVRIERAATTTDAGQTETKVELLTFEQWSAGENGLYYDRDYATGVLKLRPDPDGSETLYLYVWQPLSQIAALSLDSEAVLPEGYSDAIRYALAERLAVEWDRPLRPEVVELARQARANIKSLNTPTLYMECDSAFGVPSSSFNILTGR